LRHKDDAKQNLEIITTGQTSQLLLSPAPVLLSRLAFQAVESPKKTKHIHPKTNAVVYLPSSRAQGRRFTMPKRTASTKVFPHAQARYIF
jgi:hypothetical protein